MKFLCFQISQKVNISFLKIYALASWGWNLIKIWLILKLHCEINWPLEARGQKSMFLLFFSGSTLSQGFWKILCITSLWLVMAPHYSQYHFDPFFDFIFKTSFTQFILYFLTSLKIIIIIISGCCFL